MASCFLLCKSTRSPSINPFLFIKRYTQNSSSSGNQRQGVKERAPSLADEFRRVAEEKAKADETPNSQPSDKTYGGAGTEAVKDGDEPGGDHRRR